LRVTGKHTKYVLFPNDQITAVPYAEVCGTKMQRWYSREPWKYTGGTRL